jgi:hypothetical protein
MSVSLKSKKGPNTMRHKGRKNGNDTTCAGHEGAPYALTSSGNQGDFQEILNLQGFHLNARHRDRHHVSI